MKNLTHKLERDLLNSMIVFPLKEGKKTSFKEYYKKWKTELSVRKYYKKRSGPVVQNPD